ncbi:MAG: hypothetical protein JOZ72_12885 [Alphaproteobacteria bacterium]|nr:hypothetical protein [Alphaproteobacteria bacterium]
MSPAEAELPAADLYTRLAQALDRALAAPETGGSGFVDPAPRVDPGIFRPAGELPEHLFDRNAIQGLAKFCLFDGLGYAAIRSGAFTEFERRKLANTIQPLTLVFSGSQTVETAYPFDGRAGWICIPVEVPEALGAAATVEIERDGQLLFSGSVRQGTRDYRAGLWLVNAAGRLLGAVHGADSDVAVKVQVDDRTAWTIANPPAETGRPRTFELDLAPFCADGRVARVSVFNPATGVEAARSPVGVFASHRTHFLIARPRIENGMCRAVLMFWKDGRRQRLSLAYAEDLTLDVVAKADLPDPDDASFEGGDNSFALGLDVLGTGEVMILGEDGQVLGKLPPLAQILGLAGLLDAAQEPTPRTLVASAREAAAGRRWSEAVELWTACIARFGEKPHWLANKARALLEAGRHAEAGRDYVSLAERFAHLPDGMIGLARLAQARKDWAGALSLWTLCLEKFSDTRAPQWKAAKAQALRQLGRYAEAELLLRQLDEREPDGFAKARIQAAIDHAHQAGRTAARHDELSEEIEARFPVDGGNPDLIEGMRLLSRLGDYERARQRLLLAVPRAATAEEIDVLFRAIGEIVEAGSRGPLWEQLLGAARAVSPELELRLLLAHERFSEFERRFDALRDALAGNDNLPLLARVRARLAKPRRGVFAEPKVFGIGLSRTGTQSLTEALGIVGIDAAHWTNPLTYQLIGPTDVYLFGACTDISVAQDFEKLYYQYPNARFVWTQRPLEGWKASVTRHYEFWHRASGIAGIGRELDRGTVPFGLSRAAIEFGLYLNETDFAAAHLSFERRVRGFFRDKPAGKLLELDVFAGEGWAELCAFLGCAVPDRPFPHSNKGL